MNDTLQQLLSPMNIGFGLAMIILFIVSLWRIIKNPKGSYTKFNSISWDNRNFYWNIQWTFRI